MKVYQIFLITLTVASVSCQQRQNTKNDLPGSFGYDSSFIVKHDSSAIVLGKENARVIVSPKYQAKVFTSSPEGDTGTSFGWIHYKAFDGPLDPHMNAYGGENRLWLGPEGGTFSLFFPPGAKMEFASWKTPAPFDSEPWKVQAHDSASVTLQKNMLLKNYAGTDLDVTIDRKITILSRDEINRLLVLEAIPSVEAVGYMSENKLTNSGTFDWNEKTGMPCLWLLDMFNPSDSTTICIPYSAKDTAKPATTNYFGEIPADRIKYGNGILYFKADGKSRGKLGMHPAVAKNVAGSYDAAKKILTIILFDIDNNGRYLNQEWVTNKPPFSGDAVNAYNDGPLADGTQMGPFYELESVSPAAFLKPGGSLIHHHAVFHFTGDEKGLNTIAEKVLGVSLESIEQALK
ncbi:MAG TPA: DUF6786 family protein [Hanamia sp.]|nr:DUF6786 family protein [Hanamia sp.]